MRMITALNENTNLVQDLTTTGEGRLCVESSPRYADLGEVISTTLAAYAETLAEPVDMLSWVRQVVIRATCIGGRSEDTCQVRLYRRIVSGDAGALPVELALFVQDENALYPAHCCAVDVTPGFGAQLALFNNSTYACTATLSIQLLG